MLHRIYCHRQQGKKIFSKVSQSEITRECILLKTRTTRWLFHSYKMQFLLILLHPKHIPIPLFPYFYLLLLTLDSFLSSITREHFKPSLSCSLRYPLYTRVIELYFMMNSSKEKRQHLVYLSLFSSISQLNRFFNLERRKSQISSLRN